MNGANKMYYALLGMMIYAFSLSSIIKRSKIISEILGIVLLTFITFMIGLRYGVGIDYFSYEAGFNMRYDVFAYEPIYSFLMYFIKTQFDKFHYLTFVMILITNLFIYLGLRKRDIKGTYLILAIFIYSSNMALVFMNAMRQGVAVSIFFYATTFIKERNFKKYLVYILIGAGFHSSILLLLPLYFIKDIKISKHKYFFMVVAAYIFVYTGVAQTILNCVAYWIPMFSKYYNHDYIFNEDIKLLSLGVLLNIVFISFILKLVKEEKKYQIDVSYYLIGTIINILAISSFMFDRIGVYFFVFGISAIPQIIRSIEKNELRGIVFSLATIVALMFFIQSLFLNPEAMRLEYRSIFSK